MKSLRITLLFLICLLSSAAAAQAQFDRFRDDFQPQTGAASVTAASATLRGTPDSRGVPVTTVNRGERLELVGKIRTWYLVQTARYVGWIPGSAIRLGAPANTSSADDDEPAVNEGNSPFTAEYIGGDVAPAIIIRNTTPRRLTIVMNRVTYNVRPNTTQTIRLDGGNYRYRASVPGIPAISGSNEFRRGYQYTWEFRIVTRRVR